jgi:hypothetical protein
MLRLLLIIGTLLFSFPSLAQAPTQLCFPTNTGKTNCVPVDASNPYPVVSSGSSGTLPWLPTYISSQYGLAVGTNTTPTVPALTKCALINVETANVRYTEDGTSASTTNGQLVSAGTSFSYCASSLTALKFTAVSGSPTIDVSYFK